MRYGLIFLLYTVILGLLPGQQAQSASLEELREVRDRKNEEIQRIEEGAKKYRDEVVKREEIGKTLKGEIKRVNGIINQLTLGIAVNERTLERTKLEIETLSLEIRDKEIALLKFHSGLASLIQSFSEEEQESTIAILIRHATLSEFFRAVDGLATLKEKIVGSLRYLRAIKDELETKRQEARDKEETLAKLDGTLRARKETQENVRLERNELIKITKNEEKKYQELLREQERKRNLLEEELREIEEAIRITIDPASLPSRGSGVLGSPLPDISLASCWKGGSAAKNCLTQLFGHTSFATVGGYQGKGHNGVDFRADVGTQVFSAGEGEVEATGDTDSACRRASYGKWILVRHPNNLSTLYAHLAHIGVAPGQLVTRGAEIGLSGQSGYATGPHLHFSVFASQAVRIESIRSRVCGRLMTLPIAAINGYLNPLDYL